MSISCPTIVSTAITFILFTFPDMTISGTTPNIASTASSSYLVMSNSITITSLSTAMMTTITSIKSTSDAISNGSWNCSNAVCRRGTYSSY